LRDRDLPNMNTNATHEIAEVDEILRRALAMREPRNLQRIGERNRSTWSVRAVQIRPILNDNARIY